MLKPLNDWVFIERDPIEKDRGGIIISEKALTKSLRGVIRKTASEKFAKVGDRIHLPHYRVKDCMVDGVEYAAIKESDLFAIEEKAEFRPINRYIKIRKCENDHIRDESGEIALYMTEKHIENTNWVEIIEVATDCKYLDQGAVGCFCVAPENDDRLRRLGDTKDFMLHEDLIGWYTTG